jgi:short-subunit dehydrogenase
MKKIIVVSGGTKGIGKAIIEQFSAHNFDVITCSRNKHDLEALKVEVEEKYNNRVMIKVADLSKRHDIKTFVDFVLAESPAVHVLVNNAGIFIPGALSEEEEGALERMINTNLYSAYHLTRGLLGTMRSRGEGHIFNICSTASIVPYINGGSYCISKFALLGFSKVLREEMKEKNIRVTAVLPGATLTASWEGVDVPEERFMASADVAALIFNAYTISDRSVVEEILVRPQKGDL